MEHMSLSVVKFCPLDYTSSHLSLFNIVTNVISTFSWRNMRSSAANCRQKRTKIHLSSRWSSSPQITSSLSRVSGISCVNSASSRRQLVKLSQSSASTKRHRWRSRTSVSGWDTIPVQELTTCTVSTVTWPSEELSPSATATWLPAIVLVPIQSRWDSWVPLTTFSGVYKFFFSFPQIIKIEKVVAAKTRRSHIKQFHDSKIKFPLVQRYHHKRYRQTFSINRPTTHFN